MQMKCEDFLAEKFFPVWVSMHAQADMYAYFMELWIIMCKE